MINFQITRLTAQQAAKVGINPADARRMHVTVGTDNPILPTRWNTRVDGRTIAKHTVTENEHTVTLLRKIGKRWVRAFAPKELPQMKPVE